MDTDKFYSDLDRAKRKLDDLTKDHRVKISAVFDNGDIARARKMFADLDNAISRDAAQRLKSSPQGSVLGSLNSLFSPHPVSGAPTPQMSAQSGLLGRMISEPGGGGPVGSAGGQGGVSPLRQVLEGAGPQGNQSGDDYIRQVVTGQGAQNANTTDAIRQVLTGNTPGNVSTEDMIRQVVTGSGPQDTTTRDTIKEAIDPASRAKVIADSSDMGDRSGNSFSVMFTGHAKDMLGKVAGLFGGGDGDKIKDAAGKSGDDSGGGFTRNFSAKIIGGIGPLIIGVSAKMALLVPAIGTALAVLPALMGVIGLGMGVAMIGGVLAGVIANSPALKAQFAGIGTDAKQLFTAIGKPIIPAISAALKQVGPLIKSLTPALTGIMKVIAPQISGIFAGIGPILKSLVSIMQAAAPAFGPFIEGLEKLVGNLLPGILAVIKPTIPFIKQFGDILGSLGSSLGKMFSAAAPAIGASMTVLGALLGLIGGLLPILVKMGDVFATALAPVITQFAGVLKSLMPTLVVVGNVLASLAGAIIGDLASALGAVAVVLVDIGPALGTFAKTLGLVFNTLENSGVFPILGDAIEDLAAPLGKLISALLNGLSPILPPLFTAVGQIAGIIAGGLAAGIVKLLPPLTKLATEALGVIAKILPVVLPLLVTMAGIFTAGVVALISGVAVALTAIINAIPPSVLDGIVIGVLALVAAFKTAAIISVIMDAISANPIILIAAAAALLVIGITELVTHWKTVWATIKSVASDVGSFLDDLFHNHIVQAILDVDTLGLVPLAQHWTEVWGNIKGWASDTASFFVKLFHNQVVQTILDIWSLGLIPLAEHWTAVWGDVKTTAEGFWNWLHQVFGTDVEGFFTKTIPGWFDTFIGFVHSRFATPFQNAMKAAWDWVVSNVLDPMDTFITQTVPGWYDAAVGAIARFWDKIENDVLIPVKFVVSDVLNPMGQAFDDITNAIGLGKPIGAISMASGGKIPGYGGGDVVPALLERGETVIDKDKSSKWAWLFKAMGVPGYSSGGILGGIGGLLTGAAWDALKQLVPGLGAISSVTDLTVKTTGVLDKIAARGDQGAAGTLGNILTAIPKTVVKDLVSWLGGHAKAPAPAGKGGGSATPGLETVARYVMSHGGNKYAGAGVAGTVAGESGGDPEAEEAGGGGGQGLLQWTYPTVPFPIADIITGNAGLDMANQLVDMMAYIGSRGGIGSINAAGSALGAAEVFSAMEAPAVPGSDIRPDVVAALYAQGLAKGGLVYDQGGLITEPVIGFGQHTGRQYTIGGSGPEWVTPAGSAGPAGSGGMLANNLSIMMPEGASLAAAFTELNFRLKVAQQQGWAGLVTSG